MHYVGIDLGTTNSAICSYDGEQVHTYKSPDQHTVTPSAIYVDRRTRYYGRRAYDAAARSPENVALFFKRLMGTNTPIPIPAAELVMSPEECSAEILKVLYSYLPEEIRNSRDTGTVITVPAAFDQMQRDATLSAAEMAGIGRVALMQEPVAAVMSVMRSARRDGIFVIYDLGGGTFDAAIAESIGGQVSLLENGGIPMCGGRDFDRVLVEKVVMPWIRSNFRLPDQFAADPRYKRLTKLASWASENAKIQLSFGTNALISIGEDETRIADQDGKQLYLDIPLHRTIFEEISRPLLDETIEATRQTLKRTSLTTDNIDRIVFVGGPTQFKPLRDYVCQQLGLPPDTKIDPMTAVAEGAAIFAESIDWGSTKLSRKTSKGSISLLKELSLSFEFLSRTTEGRAKIVVRCEDRYLRGEHFQLDSLDTGWSSGRIKLMNGVECDVTLPKTGPNSFKITLFSSSGSPVTLANDTITVTRTAGSIQGIPASHSIGVEVKESLYSSSTKIRYLIKKGDQLPKKGREIFKAAEELQAGSNRVLVFKLYEGEIVNPATDNRFVGIFKIAGSQVESGIVKPGDELVCEYEASESGRLAITVSIPSVGGTFMGNDLYSRQEAQIDYSNARLAIQAEAETTLSRLQEIELKVQDKELPRVRQKLDQAQSLCANNESDPEAMKQAGQKVQEARTMLSGVRASHLTIIRQTELDSAISTFDKHAREHAKATEVTAFENMARAAQRLKDNSSGEFDNILDEMRSTTWNVLWREDDFAIGRFQWLSEQHFFFPDQKLHAGLVEQGHEALKRNDLDLLRRIVLELYRAKATTSWSDELHLSNII